MLFAAGIVLATILLISDIYTAEKEGTKFENHKVFDHFSDKRRYLNQLLNLPVLKQSNESANSESYQQLLHSTMTLVQIGFTNCRQTHVI